MGTHIETLIDLYSMETALLKLITIFDIYFKSKKEMGNEKRKVNSEIRKIPKFDLKISIKEIKKFEKRQVDFRIVFYRIAILK